MERRLEGRRRIAFYAPLKAPEHPTPSGDRAMARLILQALDIAGYEVNVASDLRSFSREPDLEVLANIQEKASAVRASLLTSLSFCSKPDLWLTYHPFYKSPDLIGPFIAEEFGIPYVTIEASHAPKRNSDDWQPWQALTEQALRLGEAHFSLTRRDRLGLAAFFGNDAKLIDLPPFLDVRPFNSLVHTRQASGPIELMTIAMMRSGDKLRSYQFLAEALVAEHSLPDWRLTIIGDGPARSEVEAAFADVDPTRLTWLGACGAQDIRAALSSAHLYIWPGFGEAYGMAYLEAQAAGVPVLALDCGGISEVVRHGETGTLVSTHTPEAFSVALATTLAARNSLKEMGSAARRFVFEERTLEHAAGILTAGIQKVLG